MRVLLTNNKRGRVQVLLEIRWWQCVIIATIIYLLGLGMGAVTSRSSDLIVSEVIAHDVGEQMKTDYDQSFQGLMQYMENWKGTK